MGIRYMGFQYASFLLLRLNILLMMSDHKIRFNEGGSRIRPKACGVILMKLVGTFFLWPSFNLPIAFYAYLVVHGKLYNCGVVVAAFVGTSVLDNKAGNIGKVGLALSSISLLLTEVPLQMDRMEVEQYYEDPFGQNDCQAEGNSMLKWRSFSGEVGDSNDGLSTEFDCNICLDAVQDPVVTLCGHLYCWPCIYKWIHCQSESAENYDLQQPPQCPVCKAKVSQDTLVPLFGRGQTETTRSCRSIPPNIGITIPRRPLAYGFDSPRLTPTASSSRPAWHVYNSHIHPSQRYYSESVAYPAPPSIGPSGMTTNMFEPLLGTVGELIHTRVFGTSMGNMLTYSNSYHLLATNASPRVRRHVMQADRSLSRILLFLLCCAFFCLLLF